MSLRIGDSVSMMLLRKIVLNRSMLVDLMRMLRWEPRSRKKETMLKPMQWMKMRTVAADGRRGPQV